MYKCCHRVLGSLNVRAVNELDLEFHVDYLMNNNGCWISCVGRYAEGCARAIRAHNLTDEAKGASLSTRRMYC